jgi:hypothetical protein
MCFGRGSSPEPRFSVVMDGNGNDDYNNNNVDEFLACGAHRQGPGASTRSPPPPYSRTQTSPARRQQAQDPPRYSQVVVARDEGAQRLQQHQYQEQQQRQHQYQQQQQQYQQQHHQRQHRHHQRQWPVSPASIGSGLANGIASGSTSRTSNSTAAITTTAAGPQQRQPPPPHSLSRHYHQQATANYAADPAAQYYPNNQAYSGANGEFWPLLSPEEAAHWNSSSSSRLTHDAMPGHGGCEGEMSPEEAALRTEAVTPPVEKQRAKERQQEVRQREQQRQEEQQRRQQEEEQRQRQQQQQKYQGSQGSRRE